MIYERDGAVIYEEGGTVIYDGDKPGFIYDGDSVVIYQREKSRSDSMWDTCEGTSQDRVLASDAG